MFFIDAPTATTTALSPASAGPARPPIQGDLSSESEIRKPPDVRLPGSQPGPTLALPDQPMWTRPRRTTGHSWACIDSETTENAARARGNLFSENLLRLTCCRPLVRNPSRPRGLRPRWPCYGTVPQNSLWPLRESRSGAHTGGSAGGVDRRGAGDLARRDRSARRDGKHGRAPRNGESGLASSAFSRPAERVSRRLVGES
ncbi:hypothetical protein B0J12DRAFT_392528 [Macrophomina phaseolina]|uniref:Uncharacterized protein n=1 Tax=Macrophomina phaseolina TaxID=35725 RepID=A0ABQ8FS93_9PEZI|nr:hypothetical protein B0J12DRAFT_392528 [Macrophomina phaseolina]